MVIGVFKIILDNIVVNILAGDLRMRLINAHSLQLEHHHCPRRILHQRLVDFEPNLLTHNHFSR